MRHDDGFSSAWSDPVSRRNLLRAAGVGLGAVALGGFASGCTSETPNGRTADHPSGDGDAPAGGGEIAAATASVFADLDPTVASAVGTIAINRFIYRPLYRLDPFPPRSGLTPELAADLPAEVDALTYRVPLRDDVVFHDGSPMTAADVVFTIERIKNPDVGSLFARFFEIVETVEATGDHEVELRLTAPTTLLAQRLVLVNVMSHAAVDASPDALTTGPVGTGPYRTSSVVSGQEAALTLFTEYVGDGDYHYDDLRIAVTADGNARTSSLRSGQVQIVEDVPASSFDSLASADGVQVEGARGDHMTGLMFHCGKPPFDDVRVRQAVMFAIDRDSITQTSFFGHAEPVWAGEIAADSPDYAEPDLIYSYDPDRARRLLADAGLGAGDIAIDLLAGNLEYLSSQVPIIEENLRAVGFRANVIPGELESLYSRVTEGSYHAFLMKGDTSALGPTDPEFLLRWIYYGATPRQFMYWTGEPLQRVEQLLDQALTAPGDDTRRQALAEVQNIAQNEVPIGRLHRSDYLTGWSDALQNFRPIPTSGFVLDGVRG